jgi:DNA-binding MarR family transcriptional regulator
MVETSNVVRVPVDRRDDWDEGRRSIGGLLAVALRTLTAEHHRRLDAAGYPDLRPGSGNVFEHIGADGSTVAAMAERAGISPQAMVQIVDALQACGYVERVPDPTDRRAKIVRLTARGQTADRTARENLRAIEAEWADRLGEDRFRQLRASLADLVAALDDRSRPERPRVRA